MRNIGNANKQQVFVSHGGSGRCEGGGTAVHQWTLIRNDVHGGIDAGLHNWEGRSFAEHAQTLSRIEYFYTNRIMLVCIYVYMYVYKMFYAAPVV